MSKIKQAKKINITNEQVWLRLTGLKGLGSKKMHIAARRLLKTQNWDPATLNAAGLNDAQAKHFLQPHRPDVDEALKWLAQPHHCLLTAEDPDFPRQLKNISRYPALLFVAGNVEVLSSPQIAIVGSRDCSHYGRKWGEEFSHTLASCGLTITSGLARGIDAVAHRATIKAGGKTIAVLGSGFHHLYPRQHRELAKEIVSSGGAIVSEFPLNFLPYPQNFPRRNRIISGLCLGVLVVEASLKSGSLVTARYALEQNREVFALPGSLDNPSSEGANWLIQEGALLVTEPKHILDVLQHGFRWLPPLTQDDQTRDDQKICHEKTELPSEFADILRHVDYDLTPIDVIVGRTKKPVSVVVSHLLELELMGCISPLPGGYVRIKK